VVQLVDPFDQLLMLPVKQVNIDAVCLRPTESVTGDRHALPLDQNIRDRPFAKGT
jgi:hypothetical protein